MTHLLERARDLGQPVTLTTRLYPEQGVETVALLVRVPDGTIEWRSDAAVLGSLEPAVVAMARMMGVEVFAC